MASNLYRNRSTINTLFYPTSSIRSEIDLRQEVINTLDGLHPEIAKAQMGLLRKMKVNSNGDFILCTCIDSITKEPDRDRLCPFCLGVGKIWEETLVKYYTVPIDSDPSNAILNRMVGAGLINAPLLVFYVRYSANITRFDQIIELEKDEEGELITPYRRKVAYTLERVKDYRADNGRIEYFKLWAHEEKVKWLNVPTYQQLSP